MVNLKLRSEYSFRTCFGRIDHIINSQIGNKAAGIADYDSTWGHYEFYKKCKKEGIKPILGVQLNVCKNLDKEKKQRTTKVTLLARNIKGLKDIYALVGVAWKQMYYVPRITVDQLNSISDDSIILVGSNPIEGISHPNLWYEINPGFGYWNNILARNDTDRKVVTSDVYFPYEEDRKAYEVVCDNPERKTTPQHILTESDMISLGYDKRYIDESDSIADMCDSYDFPQSYMVEFGREVTLLDMCLDGAKSRNLELTKEYSDRLHYELDMIYQKKFEDYFYLVSDLIKWSKKYMFVGPARGSSAGSLVCYLLYITEVDPLKFDLLFERFIDLTRADLPDIDVDFPDDKRQMAIDYLTSRYGEECVSHIGTITKYKAKSAIGEVAKKYNIPSWETVNIKNSIIERSQGDSRAASCIKDTFDTLDVGKDFVKKFPSMRVVERIEDHARNSGCHAAGIIVSKNRISDFCSVSRDNVAQIDKKTAESIGALKIDVLGLRTLSVLNSCMEMIGKNPNDLYQIDITDTKPFELINSGKFSGIFQFEGATVQSMCKEMKLHSFDDIATITSIARPGPLNCGGATSFTRRKTLKEEIEYDHPICERFIKDTLGVIVYQEQIMQMSREIGMMSWDDVCIIRKAVSKSYGEEFFGQYIDKFVAGAKTNGLSEEVAMKIWNNMCTFGSYGFNKSHAVAYAMISYYCMWLKYYHPLEFALACLRNEKDQPSTLKLLRELVSEGVNFIPFDYYNSAEDWSIHEGAILGGFKNVKGVGSIKARDIVNRRDKKLPMTHSQRMLTIEAYTPYDNIFEITDKFKDLYDNPQKYKITSQKPCRVNDIDGDGTWIFVGRLVKKDVRDMNSYDYLVKRGGVVYNNNTQSMILDVEDDTGSIKCSINRFLFDKYGKEIMNEGKIGDFYLVKGSTSRDFKIVQISMIKRLEG